MSCHFGWVVSQWCSIWTIHALIRNPSYKTLGNSSKLRGSPNCILLEWLLLAGISSFLVWTYMLCLHRNRLAQLGWFQQALASSTPVLQVWLYEAGATSGVLHGCCESELRSSCLRELTKPHTHWTHSQAQAEEFENHWQVPGDSATVYKTFSVLHFSFSVMARSIGTNSTATKYSFDFNNSSYIFIYLYFFLSSFPQQKGK